MARGFYAARKPGKGPALLVEAKEILGLPTVKQEAQK